MNSPEAIAARISEHLQNLPTKSISGTELASFLRYAFPGFSPFTYHSRNLRMFLLQFVPGVVPVGRSGGDLLYGFKPSNPEPTEEGSFVAPAEPSLERPETRPAVQTPSPSITSQTATTTMSRELWKSFASPNSLWRIYANPESGEVRLLPPSRVGLPQP